MVGSYPRPSLWTAYISALPYGGCSSAWLECRTVTAEVAGSSPVSPARSLDSSPRPPGRGVVFQPLRVGMVEPDREVPPAGAAHAGARRCPREHAGWSMLPWATGATPRHSSASARRSSGIDRDPRLLLSAGRRLGESRIQYLQAPYASPEALAAVARFRAGFHPARSGGLFPPTGRGGRGFTFRPGAPLDMRMGACGRYGGRSC